MTGKQEDIIVELLQQVLAELKLLNHKKFKSPIKAKNFRYLLTFKTVICIIK